MQISITHKMQLHKKSRSPDLQEQRNMTTGPHVSLPTDKGPTPHEESLIKKMNLSVQSQKRMRHPAYALTSHKKGHTMSRMQTDKRMHSSTPQDTEPVKRTMHFYNTTPTPGQMASRRINVRQVLKQEGVLPDEEPSDEQLSNAFNAYTNLRPKDYDITLENIRDIASAYHGGKMRHKKHVHSYKKRSMNKKRAKSMKKK